MAQSAAMPRKSVQRARRGGLDFDLMFVFMISAANMRGTSRSEEHTQGWPIA